MRLKRPIGRPRTRGEECTVAGCLLRIYARELCSRHYDKLRVYGDPLAGRSHDMTLGITTLANKLGVSRQRAEQLLKPERAKAREKVSIAVKQGHLIRPQFCMICQSPGLVAAHHIRYDWPLAVIWLCPKCHAEIHKNSSWSHS